MNSRNTAKKIVKAVLKAAAKVVKVKNPKPKLAKITRFPSNQVARKPLPPAKKAPQAAALKKPASSPPVSRNLPALTAPRNVQQPKQSLARSFYWSELRVGDDLPPLTKPPVDRVQIVRYASSSGDFNRLHLDEPYAHAVGFPGLFAPGMLPMAFVGQLLSAWLRRGHVRKLSARFVKIVWPQDELTCRGRISELRKEGGGCYADVELWAENQKGELVLRGQATCELYESPAAGGGEGGGLLFALQSKAAPGPLAAPAPRKPEAAKPKPQPPKKK